MPSADCASASRMFPAALFMARLTPIKAPPQDRGWKAHHPHRGPALNRVQGMTCIVTGGAVGIGHACALRLAGEGAAVAIFDRLDAEGLALVDTITRAGGKAGYWHVDVTREADVARAIDEVADRFGGVDVLVNNAGISGSTRLTHEKSPRPSGTRCRRSTSRASCSAPSTRSRACAAQAGAASSTSRRSTAWSARRTCRPTTRPRARSG